MTGILDAYVMGILLTLSVLLAGIIITIGHWLATGRKEPEWLMVVGWPLYAIDGLAALICWLAARK